MKYLKNSFVFLISFIFTVFVVYKFILIQFYLPSLNIKPKYNFIFFKVSGTIKDKIKNYNLSFYAKVLKLNKENKIILENFTCFANNTFKISSKKAIILNGSFINMKKIKTQINIKR